MDKLLVNYGQKIKYIVIFNKKCYYKFIKKYVFKLEGEMDKFKELILRKPNEIIEVINRPLSTMSWNAYNFILTKLQEKRTNQIIISPAEILKAIGATNLHEELYKCLDELQKTQVSSIDKKGKLWGGFVLLSAFKKNDKGLYIEIPQLIADRMFKNEDLYYTTIKLIEQKSFKCSYSLVFYEIFKKYENVIRSAF